MEKWAGAIDERLKHLEKAVEELRDIAYEVRVHAEQLTRMHADWAQLHGDMRALNERPHATWNTARGALVSSVIAALVSFFTSRFG